MFLIELRLPGEFRPLGNLFQAFKTQGTAKCILTREEVNKYAKYIHSIALLHTYPGDYKEDIKVENGETGQVLLDAQIVGISQEYDAFRDSNIYIGTFYFSDVYDDKEIIIE